MLRTIHGFCAFMPLVLSIYMILVHIQILPMIDFPNGVYITIATLLIVAEILTLRMIYAPKKVSDSKKAFWTILVVMFNILVLPLFWIIYVYPKNTPKRKSRRRKK